MPETFTLHDIGGGRMRPDFPLVWDNTMRSAFVECPRKFELEFIQHWKPQGQRVDLHAGAAWAHGLERTRKEFYCNGLDSDTAIARGIADLLAFYGDFICPENNPKTAARLSEAFVYYFERYPLATDPAQPWVGPHGPMIEFSFVHPLDDSLVHPITGDPILYSGRADMVANYLGACTIFDDKTTKSLGASWTNQWDLRSQFTGYCWGAQIYGIPAQQVLARGIGILKTKFDTANAIVHREPWRVERWHGQVLRDIRRAMQLWEEGFFDMVEADACNSYGGCMFKQPCLSRDPEPWLEIAFTRRRWDPVTRSEIEVVKA